MNGGILPANSGFPGERLVKCFGNNKRGSVTFCWHARMRELKLPESNFPRELGGTDQLTMPRRPRLNRC